MSLILDKINYVYSEGTAYQIQALKDVNLEIKDGQFIGVIGHTGSGKSTFLRCLNLLEEPTAGTITVDGVDITDPKTDIDKIRQRMGMVFQQFNLFPHLTIKENIKLAPVTLKLMSDSEADQKAMELLERVGLPDKADAYPKQLSGGQQQRVAIARALIAKPRIVFADEPTGNLDTRTGEDTMRLLMECAAEFGQTLIVVTHNPEIAQKAQQVIRIEDGWITGNV